MTNNEQQQRNKDEQNAAIKRAQERIIFLIKNDYDSTTERLKCKKLEKLRQCNCF
jgi:hypothetical protein